VKRISRDDLYKLAGANSVPAGCPADQPWKVSPEDNRSRKQWSDDQIELAVMNVLHWDLTIPRNRIQVSVNRGWVTLTGQVRHGYERSKAEADARLTGGVAGVVNEIMCKPPE
jgi:osmotically-inducible protein OsmY